MFRFRGAFSPRLDYPRSRELDKRMPHSSFGRGGMSRTFNTENEYTRCTCSPGSGCRLGSVQLGVLISGYFIPPPFRFAPPTTSTSHRSSASPVLIPESASLSLPSFSPFVLLVPADESLSPVPALKCTTAPPVGQYEQEAYIANYTVLCHRAQGWYRNREKLVTSAREARAGVRGARGATPSLCATRRDRRFSYYPFYRFHPREYQKRGCN